MNIINTTVVNIKAGSLNENIPSAYLLSAIKSSEVNKKKGEIYSFKNNKEAIDFLNNQ